MPEISKRIQASEANLKTADHLLYSSFPLLRDKRILIKAIHELDSALKSIISAILQYEFISKNIKIYKNPKKNFKTFVKNCSQKYGITKEEIKKIIELSEISKAQEKSPMEFLKDKKMIIFSTEMNVTQIDIEDIKNFLLTAKNIMKKTKEKLELI